MLCCSITRRFAARLTQTTISKHSTATEVIVSVSNISSPPRYSLTEILPGSKKILSPCVRTIPDSQGDNPGHCGSSYQAQESAADDNRSSRQCDKNARNRFIEASGVLNRR